MNFVYIKFIEFTSSNIIRILYCFFFLMSDIKSYILVQEYKLRGENLQKEW